MKQALLIFVFGLMVNMTFAQGRGDCVGCGDSNMYPSYGTAQTASFSEQQLAIYPNPATDFFKIKQTSGVKEVKIFNLVGRQVKDFSAVTKDQSFQVADLPSGMYLVQLINFRNEVITTHRLNKR